MRRCFECKRDLPEPVIPEDASSELAAAFQATARVCQWCLTVNLLCGGFTFNDFETRWSEEEREEMQEEALRRNVQRQQRWQYRREQQEFERQRQGELTFA